ncbi:MAG: protein TolR [Desulfobulbus propionicus]|nr:MAG: protein TolR [Desulfobulbus propionicus]
MESLGLKNKKGFVAEINVTPLVDVMLVLLIIFMVSAPMMTQGVDVNLPETTTRALEQPEKPFVVTIDKGGGCFIGDSKTEVGAERLRSELDRYSGEKKQNTVYLRADRDVPYGAVAGVLSEIHAAGFTKVGMVTLQAEKKEQGSLK